MRRSLWLPRLAKIAVSAVLIAAVIWKVGPNAVVPERLRWGYLLIGVGLFLASNLFGAYQWNLLLRSANIELAPRVVTRAYFVALFFNNFLIGGIGGDVLRALDLRRNSEQGSHGRTAAGVATIVMDRFLGFFTMMWFAGAAAWLTAEHSGATGPIAVLLASFVVLGILLTSRRVGRRFDGLVVRMLPDRMAQTVVDLRTGFVAMRRRYWFLFFATFVSVLVQGMRILVHYVCARAVGVQAPLVYFFTFIPVVGVAAAIPVSFGGLGPREWAAVGLFRTVGIGGAGVVAMELVAHATTLVSCLPGAVAFIVRGGRSSAATAVRSEPEVKGA